jgi:hypothetical protein
VIRIVRLITATFRLLFPAASIGPGIHRATPIFGVAPPVWLSPLPRRHDAQMRLREYDRLFAARFDDPGLGHARWMRPDVTVTVLAAALDQPDLPRAGVFGRIGSDAFCVVVTDDGKLEYLLDRGAPAGDLDLDLMRRDLGVLARHALERLADNPGDRLWNGLFRAAVWAATTPLCTTFTAGARHVAAFDSADAVPDSADAAPRSLAALIPADPDLAAALARAVADPSARGDLDAAAGDLAPATLTAAGVVADLVGTAIEADVTVDQVAVAGHWPAGSSSPVHATPVWWNDLDWYLLPVPRRRRAVPRTRRGL